METHSSTTRFSQIKTLNDDGTQAGSIEASRSPTAASSPRSTSGPTTPTAASPAGGWDPRREQLHLEGMAEQLGLRTSKEVLNERVDY